MSKYSIGINWLVFFLFVLFGTIFPGFIISPINNFLEFALNKRYVDAWTPAATIWLFLIISCWLILLSRIVIVIIRKYLSKRK